MRTTWQNRFAVFESIFYLLKPGSRPRRRILADLGYHLALWLFLGFVYTLSAVYQTQWEWPKRVDPMSQLAQPAMGFIPTIQNTTGQKTIGRHSREKRRSRYLSDS